MHLRRERKRADLAGQDERSLEVLLDLGRTGCAVGRDDRARELDASGDLVEARVPPAREIERRARARARAARVAGAELRAREPRHVPGLGVER